MEMSLKEQTGELRSSTTEQLRSFLLFEIFDFHKLLGGGVWGGKYSKVQFKS